mgnify:CR=1 FL=1
MEPIPLLQILLTLSGVLTLLMYLDPPRPARLCGERRLHRIDARFHEHRRRTRRSVPAHATASRVTRASRLCIRPSAWPRNTIRW